MTTRPFTIALSGKGGTGKTTISSLLVRAFIAAGESPVLAVDADPNANFHEALGVEVRDTGEHARRSLHKEYSPGHEPARLRAVPVPAGTGGIKGIRSCRDGPARGHRCYCFANDLLSECMQQLERDYRFLVIDTEAGMEHISRGTIGKPDVLLIVSDPGARGLRTIARIREIATQLGLEPSRIHVVFNRYKSGAAPVDIGGEKPIATIPEDPAVEAADLAATPVPGVPDDSPAWQAVRGLAGKLIEMAHARPDE